MAYRMEEKAIIRDYDNDSDESEGYATEPRVTRRSNVALVVMGLLAGGCIAAFSGQTQRQQMSTRGLIQAEDTLTPCLGTCTEKMTSCKKGRRLFLGDVEKMAESSSMKCDADNVECQAKCHADNAASLQQAMQDAQKKLGGKGGISSMEKEAESDANQAEKDLRGKGGISSMEKEAESDADEVQKDLGGKGGISSIEKEAQSDADEAEKDLGGNGDASSLEKEAEKDADAMEKDVDGKGGASSLEKEAAKDADAAEKDLGGKGGAESMEKEAENDAEKAQKDI